MRRTAHALTDLLFCEKQLHRSCSCLPSINRIAVTCWVYVADRGSDSSCASQQWGSPTVCPSPKGCCRHSKYLHADLADDKNNSKVSKMTVLASTWYCMIPEESSEGQNKVFDTLRTVEGVKMLPAPRDEHHSLGLAERAVQTIDLSWRKSHSARWGKLLYFFILS